MFTTFLHRLGAMLPPAQLASLPAPNALPASLEAIALVAELGMQYAISVYQIGDLVSITTDRPSLQHACEAIARTGNYAAARAQLQADSRERRPMPALNDQAQAIAEVDLSNGGAEAQARQLRADPQAIEAFARLAELTAKHTRADRRDEVWAAVWRAGLHQLAQGVRLYPLELFTFMAMVWLHYAPGDRVDDRGDEYIEIRGCVARAMLLTAGELAGPVAGGPR